MFESSSAHAGLGTIQRLYLSVGHEGIVRFRPADKESEEGLWDCRRREWSDDGASVGVKRIDIGCVVHVSSGCWVLRIRRSRDEDEESVELLRFFGRESRICHGCSGRCSERHVDHSLVDLQKEECQHGRRKG